MPLCQFVTEKHDANTLSYWIREWMRFGIALPKQIVSDFSLALLNASALSFNNVSLKQYVDECFNQLITNETVINKQTILRIDIAHLIKFVIAWPCLKNKRPHKEFYVRCVDKLMWVKTFKEFKLLLTHVLIVANAKYYDSCKNSYNYLKDLMKTDKEFPKSSDTFIFVDLSSVDDQKLDGEEVDNKNKNVKKKVRDQ